MAEDSAEVPRELTGKSRASGLSPASAPMASATLPTRAGVPQSGAPGRPAVGRVPGAPGSLLQSDCLESLVGRGRGRGRWGGGNQAPAASRGDQDVKVGGRRWLPGSREFCRRGEPLQRPVHCPQRGEVEHRTPASAL